ncbi:NUDIX domain-containing protein [Streptomyces sp. NPDC021093]|uniref:NUDIX domain-containing protein n=1 Tax=Streptomyces sp. NPDC021093 TaxID=3365112 RepID=UPI0037BADDFD
MDRVDNLSLYPRAAHPHVGVPPETGDVLLVQPSYKKGFQLVGGGAMPDEEPQHAAYREAVEETGIPHLTVGDLLLVDYIPTNPKTGAAEGLNLVFDGGRHPRRRHDQAPRRAPRPGSRAGRRAVLPAGLPGRCLRPLQQCEDFGPSGRRGLMIRPKRMLPPDGSSSGRSSRSPVFRHSGCDALSLRAAPFFSAPLASMVLETFERRGIHVQGSANFRDHGRRCGDPRHGRCTSACFGAAD